MSGIFPPPTPEQIESTKRIERLIAEARARYDAMPPIDRAIHDLEQRRSWVTAEMRMNDDASPNGRTKEQADHALKQIAPEYVVLDAYYSLKSERDTAHRERDEAEAAIFKTPRGHTSASLEQLAGLWKCPVEFARHHVRVDQENDSLKRELVAAHRERDEMRELLAEIASWDELEAHIEGAYERLLPRIQRALSAVVEPKAEEGE